MFYFREDECYLPYLFNWYWIKRRINDVLRVLFYNMFLEIFYRKIKKKSNSFFEKCYFTTFSQHVHYIIGGKLLPILI